MENKQLIIVAKIVAKPEKYDVVFAEVHKLIEPTRKEKGCISYDLHQDNEDKNTFLFYEVWESYDLWQEHMKSQHIADNGKNTEGCLVCFDVNQMTHIG